MTDDEIEFEVTFTTAVEIVVTIKAADAEIAADEAWERAEQHLDGIGASYTLGGVRIYGSLDGIGAHTVKEVRDDD
jgi:hypothetical protein